MPSPYQRHCCATTYAICGTPVTAETDLSVISDIISAPLKLSTRKTLNVVFFNGQIEVAPKTGRPHIQSFWILDKEATKKDHIKVAEKIFGLDDAGKSSTNITWPTKGSTDECLYYTSKPDLYDREWQEGDRVQGTDVFRYGEHELLPGWSPGEQGSRNDLSEIYETIKGDPFKSFDDLLEQFEGTSCFGSLVRYERFFNQTKQRLIQMQLTSSLSTELGALQLHPWQQHLMTMLSKPPHPRHVIVVLDVCGATGKSTLSALLRTGSMQFHSQGGGRREDLAYAFANFFRETPNCRGLALDLPKSLCTTSSDFRTACFTFAEQVKSRMLPTTKYESYTLVLPPLHVIIFTNSDVPDDAFAEDRVHLITLTKACNVINFAERTY